MNDRVQTTTTRFKQVCVALVSCFSVEPVWSARNAEDAGTAKRRRERRLRQFLRHERLTVAMLLAETQHHAAPRGQNTARSRVEESESELNNATGQKTPPPKAASFSLVDDGDVLAPPGRQGSATPWNRTSTPSRFRLSMCLSRRWGTSWWKCFKRSTLGPRTRLSKCPRSFLTEFHSALWRVVLRTWRNSLWKCPRSCPSFLFSSRLRSKSLTFRFLVVEVNWDFFKVYTLDRVQQRFWSRSPSLLIQVEVFKIFSQSRVPQRLLRFFCWTRW